MHPPVGSARGGLRRSGKVGIRSIPSHSSLYARDNPSLWQAKSFHPLENNALCLSKELESESQRMSEGRELSKRVKATANRSTLGHFARRSLWRPSLPHIVLPGWTVFALIDEESSL